MYEPQNEILRVYALMIFESFSRIFPNTFLGTLGYTISPRFSPLTSIKLSPPSNIPHAKAHVLQ